MAPGKILTHAVLRGLDLEVGPRAVTPSHRRRRRRASWRMPLTVALVRRRRRRRAPRPARPCWPCSALAHARPSRRCRRAQGTLAVFLFFVRLGSHSSRRGPGQRAPQAKPNTGQPTLFTYQVVQEFDHDARAFTQGLQYEERCDAKGQCRDIMWESTGLHGRSSVREVDLATGKVLRSKSLPGSDFGEGVTRLGDKLYQLVWQSGKLWTYDVDDFEKARHTQVSGEAHDGAVLSQCSKMRCHPPQTSAPRPHPAPRLSSADPAARRLGRHLQRHPPYRGRLLRHSLLPGPNHPGSGVRGEGIG